MRARLWCGLCKRPAMMSARAGLGERALKLMAERAMARTAFGKPIAEQGAFRKQLAECRVELDAARCLGRTALLVQCHDGSDPSANMLISWRAACSCCALVSMAT